MSWLLLIGAVVCEVAGTLSLRMAALGDRGWYAAVAAGYLAAFGLLAATLATGLGIGIAYGIWAALGVALTALASRVLFREALTPTMLAGIGLIILGVLAIELGAAH